ncbi:MAG: RnfABCDGE type electron transport complex subunit D, partial [Planctomycetes bacterium]|nr:RnfABCDGE type electron transport complex subunit D [Planctomycetota bacterium]
LWDAFWGNIGGNIGEVSALLLLVGVIYLVIKGYVRWYSPALYLGTVAVLAAVLPLPLGPEGSRWVWAAALRAGGDGLTYPLYHLVCGGLMLGSLYMATDMVTSPLTPKGQMIFAVGCGVLTVLIRLYGGYPEGVCYSILLMNTAVPLIDRWTRPRVFGTVEKKAAAGASS